MQKTKSQSKTNVWLPLGAGIALFTVTAVLALNNLPEPMEQFIFDYFYGWPELLTPLFLTITYSGSMYMVLFVLAGLLIAKNKMGGLHVAIGAGISYAIALIAKEAIGRPRPELLWPDVIPRELFVPGFGFPSGHTAVATAVSLLLLWHLPGRWKLLVPTWIFLVALSRLYLGVHAPLDVIGGLGVGLIGYALTMIIFTHNTLKFTPLRRKL